MCVAEDKSCSLFPNTSGKTISYFVRDLLKDVDFCLDRN